MATAICDAYTNPPKEICPNLSTVKYDAEDYEVIEDIYKPQQKIGEDGEFFIMICACLLVICYVGGIVMLLFKRVFARSLERDIEMSADSSVGHYLSLKDLEKSQQA